MAELHFEYKYVYGIGLIRVDDKRPDLLLDKLDAYYSYDVYADDPADE